MKYFDFPPDNCLQAFFFRPPAPFSKLTAQEVLRKAVGGLLYTPGTNPTIAKLIVEGKIQGLVSMAICLEDSVGDRERAAGETNLLRQLELLESALENGILPLERLPLLFVRVKDNEMLERISVHLARYSRVLTGVILPKVSLFNLERALVLTDEIAESAQEPFYAMPILESEELIIHPERIAYLKSLFDRMENHPGRVLNVRVGATDLCGLYGIRRQVDTSIYQIPLIAGCIADVVRVFGLYDRYTVSGPVWEYFCSTASVGVHGQSKEMDGLLQEVGLDLQNGILGKTCIHPSQLLAIQASYTVPYETYQDAVAISGADREASGVQASVRRNRMNELKPHALWAHKVLQQAEIYGVYRENVDCGIFLQAASMGEWV